MKLTFINQITRGTNIDSNEEERGNNQDYNHQQASDCKHKAVTRNYNQQAILSAAVIREGC